MMNKLVDKIHQINPLRNERGVNESWDTYVVRLRFVQGALRDRAKNGIGYVHEHPLPELVEGKDGIVVMMQPKRVPYISVDRRKRKADKRIMKEIMRSIYK